jgi:hypothetical protein
VAFAQLPKLPGVGKRIETQRQAASTPEVHGVSGSCKNSATREIVIQLANVSADQLDNVKVEAHPPFQVLGTKLVNGDLHLTVKGQDPSGALAQYQAQVPGPDRCDFTLKIPQGKYGTEVYASTKAEQSDAFLAAQEKQRQQQAENQRQIEAAQAQYQRAQPAMQAHQHASVGDKWTVQWANGKTETWNFSGMDNMSNMAVFKGPDGDVKIMFAGMFYTITQGQCAMMAQPQGQGKVSGKTMGGNCANSGSFTATLQ